MITNDRSTWPSGDLVGNVCQAIALAEGAQRGRCCARSLQQSGDLSKADENRQPASGYTRLSGAENLIIFASKEAGSQ